MLIDSCGKTMADWVVTLSMLASRWVLFYELISIGSIKFAAAFAFQIAKIHFYSPEILCLFRIKLVHAVLVLTALVYMEHRLIEPRLSALVHAALVYTVLVYTEWHPVTIISSDLASFYQIVTFSLLMLCFAMGFRLSGIPMPSCHTGVHILPAVCCVSHYSLAMGFRLSGIPMPSCHTGVHILHAVCCVSHYSLAMGFRLSGIPMPSRHTGVHILPAVCCVSHYSLAMGFRLSGIPMPSRHTGVHILPAVWCVSHYSLAVRLTFSLPSNCHFPPIKVVFI